MLKAALVSADYPNEASFASAVHTRPAARSTSGLASHPGFRKILLPCRKISTGTHSRTVVIENLSSSNSMSSGHRGHYEYHLPEASRMKPALTSDRDEQRPLASPRRSPSPQRFLGKRILQKTTQTNVVKLPRSLEKLQSSITKRLQAQPSMQGSGLQSPDPLESPVFHELPPSLSRKLRLQAIEEPRHPGIEQPNRYPSPDENYLSDIWKSSSSSSLSKTLPPLPLGLISGEVHEAVRVSDLRLVEMTTASSGGTIFPGGHSFLQVNPVSFQTPRPTTAEENRSRYSEQTHQEALRRYDLQLQRFRDSSTPITQVRRVNIENQVKVSSFVPKGKVAEELMVVLEESEGNFVCPAYPILNKPDGWQAYKQMAKSVKRNPSIVVPLHNAQAHLHLGDEIYSRMDRQRSSEAPVQGSAMSEEAASKIADPSNQIHRLSASRSSSSLLQRSLSIVNVAFEDILDQV